VDLLPRVWQLGCVAAERRQAQVGKWKIALTTSYSNASH
jgi:hypothetical protein